MRKRRERARQTAAADAFAPSGGEEGADIACLERQELVHIRQAVMLIGEEADELADVAAIGLDRLGGKVPLDAEIIEPGLDRLGDVRRRHELLSFDLAAHAYDPPMKPVQLTCKQLLYEG